MEENEMPETVPRRQDSQMGGCIKARDYLSGESALLTKHASFYFFISYFVDLTLT